jgi:hypothetical protein
MTTLARPEMAMLAAISSPESQRKTMIQTKSETMSSPPMK